MPNLPEKTEPACGNPECRISMFMEGYFLTFGSGKQYFDGTWEKPCSICARAYETRIRQIDPNHFTLRNPCWPFPEGLEVDILKLEPLSKGL